MAEKRCGGGGEKGMVKRKLIEIFSRRNYLRTRKYTMSFLTSSRVQKIEKPISKQHVVLQFGKD